MWPSAPRRPLAGLHLLVVDDADAILLAYGEILRRAGASVATAGDGTDACTAYEEARRSGLPFDAVVLDYVMPGLDGVEATARLRGCGFEGPIVGISAEVTNEDEDRWLAAGCDRVVCKGLPSEELVSLIAAVCGRSYG
ncbi:MAG TPA: response regulator [Planctomycetaceae bacterium]